MSNQKQHGEPCRCAEWERGRTESPSPSVHTHTAAGLPGCRQHGCHFVEEKKNRSMYRFNGLRGFLLTGANKAHPEVFTRASCICEPDTEERTSPTGRERESDLSFILIRFALFFINTAEHQYGQTPATAPKLRRTLGHYKPFILRHFQFKHCTVHLSNTNVGYTLCSSAFQQKSEGSKVTRCQRIPVFRFLSGSYDPVGKLVSKKMTSLAHFFGF